MPQRNPFSVTTEPRGTISYAPLTTSEEDEMTYADVNRQMTLIINILVSLIACGISIWLVASHWKAPARLALSMCGSSLVGVAEVVIYAGYIRRLKDAKVKEKSKKEKKTITDTWIIEKGKGPLTSPILVGDSTEPETSESVRHRKGKRR